jgi:hypothetical protein
MVTVCQHMKTHMLLAAVFLASAASTSWTAERQGANASDPFANLQRFEGNPPKLWLLSDKALRPAIEKVAGEYFDVLDVNLNTSSGAHVTNGVLAIEGCFPHSCGSDEALLVIDTAGHIYMAILTDGKEIRYFTNDAARQRKPIEAIQTFAGHNPGAKMTFMSK